jgi:hypothetical protein
LITLDESNHNDVSSLNSTYQIVSRLTAGDLMAEPGDFFERRVSTDSLGSIMISLSNSFTRLCLSENCTRFTVEAEALEMAGFAEGVTKAAEAALTYLSQHIMAGVTH